MKKTCSECGENLDEKPHIHINGNKVSLTVGKDGRVVSNYKAMDLARRMIDKKGGQSAV